jgi:ADP-ribosylglycohydrolase
VLEHQQPDDVDFNTLLQKAAIEDKSECFYCLETAMRHREVQGVDAKVRNCINAWRKRNKLFSNFVILRRIRRASASIGVSMTKITEP